MGKFDKYKIDLKGMQVPLVTYGYLLDSVFFADIDGPEVQKGRVQVQVTVRKTSHTYELTFQTEGIVWVPCDRCLDEIEIPVSSTDTLIVKFGSEYAEEGENLIVIPEEEGEINVAWFMYEFIALSLPMKHVHAPGKCNKSMTGKLSKHLRTSSDEEQEDSFGSDESMLLEDDQQEGGDKTDPRWNELKKLLDNN
ncbi:MAG: DUF177 domain-containing protein [Bacteroides sp.]|nr:DUF177 domain-containing protein [Bacteroides sp.]